MVSRGREARSRRSAKASKETKLLCLDSIGRRWTSTTTARSGMRSKVTLDIYFISKVETPFAEPKDKVIAMDNGRSREERPAFPTDHVVTAPRATGLTKREYFAGPGPCRRYVSIEHGFIEKWNQLRKVKWNTHKCTYWPSGRRRNDPILMPSSRPGGHHSARSPREDLELLDQWNLGSV